MRKFVVLLFILCFVCTNIVQASMWGQASANYSNYARNYARYYPQRGYMSQYRRSQSNYVFTPQQARYYGYRYPNQNATYGNPYYRGYNGIQRRY